MPLSHDLKRLALFSCLTLCSCATTVPLPENELTLARSSLQHAEMAGAHTQAIPSYLSAQQALTAAEQLIAAKRYREALPLLTEATALAQESEKQAGNNQPPPSPAPGISTTESSSPPPAEEASPTPFIPKGRLQPPLTSYTVQEGENLWSISARSEVYGDPLLWPLLYQGNRDQIKDPRQVHPGQTLSIQRNLSESEREEARNKARKSEVFPIEQMPRIFH